MIKFEFCGEVGTGAGLGVAALIPGACSEVPPAPPPHEIIKRLKKITMNIFFLEHIYLILSLQSSVSNKLFN